MTGIIDTHAHYDDEQFAPDRAELLTALPEQGVSRVISCGCDVESSLFNRDLSRQYGYIFFAAGLHPENLEGCTPKDLKKIEALLADEKCVAVGEIGLDYHWMSSTKEKQRAFFEAQLELANRLGLPVIVHDREAHGDTLEILKKYRPKGVLHAFSGSREMAKEILDIGMYLGFGGVLTFKNARKATEVLQEIPKERILFETDCPYMSPEPFRGRRNDSAKIAFVAQKAASLLGCTAQEITSITAENAKRLFWSGE